MPRFSEEGKIYSKSMRVVGTLADPKQNIGAAGDLLRRGATLLKEPCEKCGGLQFQYQGKTSCLNCDDLSNSGSTETLTESHEQIDPLSSLIRIKLEKVALLLKTEEDLDRQIKLSDLILKYVEILSRLSIVEK